VTNSWRQTETKVVSTTARIRSFASSSSNVIQRPSSSPEASTSKDGVVGTPIDFDVNSKIEGNESQVRVFDSLRTACGGSFLLKEKIVLVIA
jgi:hypothetical protein